MGPASEIPSVNVKPEPGSSDPSLFHGIQPINFKEFVDLAHKMCPLPAAPRRPTMSRSDGRIQAAKRLQSMLQRFTTFYMEESPVGSNSSEGSESEESSRQER